MKTASNPNRILSIDMSPQLRRLNALILPVLPQPRFHACHANRAARCAKTIRMLKLTTKIKIFCIASPFIQYPAQCAVPAPEKYAVSVPQIASTDRITCSQPSPAAQPRRLAFPKAPPSSRARPCRCYSFVRQSVDNRLQRFDMFLRLAFIPQRALARRVNAKRNFRFVNQHFREEARAVGTK